MNTFKQLAIAAANASILGGEYSQLMPSIPNGPTQHYGARPQNKNLEYYIDEKGNIRRSKRNGRNSV